MDWDSFLAERRRVGRPFVVAHRGAPLQEPENTLRSFLLARLQGADALETDLRFTRDDELILFHDPTLERMTEGSGLVREHTLAAIKQLRTRRPDGGLADAPVPTLAELIAATGGQVPLLLELKDPLFLQRKYAEKLVATLEAGQILRRTALVSFHFEHVQAVRDVCADIPVGHITLKNPWPKRGAQLLGPIWPLLYLNPLYVFLAHRMGSIVAPLDPRPEPRLAYYLRLQVDAVLADRPGEVLRRIRALAPGSQ